MIAEITEILKREGRREKSQLGEILNGAVHIQLLQFSITTCKQAISLEKKRQHSSVSIELFLHPLQWGVGLFVARAVQCTAAPLLLLNRRFVVPLMCKIFWEHLYHRLLIGRPTGGRTRVGLSKNLIFRVYQNNVLFANVIVVSLGCSPNFLSPIGIAQTAIVQTS